MEHLIVSLLLFGIGLFGALSRRNAIAILMAIELMLNAVNLNFIVFSRHLVDISGQIFALFIIATAAAEATLAVYHEEALFERARELAPYFEDAVHALKGVGPVIDVRNYGLMAGIELEPLPGKPGARGYAVFLKCYERGVMVRVTGDIVALSPPLIISKGQIDELVGTLGTAVREAATPARA